VELLLLSFDNVAESASVRCVARDKGDFLDGMNKLRLLKKKNSLFDWHTLQLPAKQTER
jgi:hypothetical protein